MAPVAPVATHTPTAFTGPAVAVSVAPLVARQAPADCLAGIVALAIGLMPRSPLCAHDSSGRYLFLLGAAGLGGCAAPAHEIAAPVRQALSPAQCRRFPHAPPTASALEPPRGPRSLCPKGYLPKPQRSARSLQKRRVKAQHREDSIQGISRATGLSRATAYRIQESPTRASAALDAWEV